MGIGGRRAGARGHSLFLGLVLAACGAPPVSSITHPPLTPPPEPTLVVREDVPPAPPAPDPSATVAVGGLVFQGAHRRGLTDLAFDRSGRLLATASADGSVAVIDVEAGVVRASRRAFVRTGSRRVRFEPGGEGLVIASSGSFFEGTGGVWRWDLRSDLFAPVLRPQTFYFDLDRFDLHPDGQHAVFAVPSDDGPAPHLRRADGTEVPLPLEPSRTRRLAFAPGGRTLQATLGGPPEHALLDARTGELLGTFPSQHAAFRPGGGLWATATREGELTLRDPRDGRPLANLRLPTPVEELRFASGGDTLLVLGTADDAVDDGLVAYLVDVRTGSLRATLRLPEESVVEPAADGSALFVATEGTLRALGLDGEELASTSLARVGLLAAAAHGRTLVVASDASIEVWEVPALRRRGAIPLERGEHSVWGVAFAPDGEELVTFGRGGVERWGRHGVVLTTCSSNAPPILRRGGGGLVAGTLCGLGATEGARPPRGGGVLSHSADGALVLLGDASGLRVADTHDLTAARPVRAPRWSAESCRRGPCAAMDAAGANVAYVSGRDVGVVELASGRARSLRGPARADAPHAVALSPDGRVLLERRAGRAGGVELRARTVADGRIRFEASMPNDQFLTTFDPGGAHLAIGSAAETRIVEVSSGRVRATGPGVASFRELRFARDGLSLVVRAFDRLVVLGLDGEVRLDAPEFAPTFAISALVDQVARCDEGRLIVESLLTAARTDRGPCRLTDELVFSPEADYLAQRDDAVVRVHRLVGAVEDLGDVLTLRTYRYYHEGALRSVPVAEDARGRFEVDASALGEFRWRGPGPIGEAPMRAGTEGPRVERLVARFFGG